MMVPVGRLTVVRTFAKSELIRAMSFVAIPGLIGPMLGPIVGGLIVAYFHWSLIFFVNIPIGLAGLCMAYLHVPDYREPTEPLDIAGLLLFGSGVALLSYVLEVFGEHTLNASEILVLLALSALLLAGYGFHATKTAYPMLNLVLFRIRTFRAAVSGSFLTRLGIGGIPFLFPLLYQVGLGFTPIQSGLLILLFATIGMGTPVWLIVTEVFCYGFFTSLQYTSMNTLVYADISEVQESGASSIASTAQQMAISFGVASASLVTAVFIPEHYRSNPTQFIQGIHRAFLVLGGMTLLSTITFRELKRGDGDAVSQRTGLHAG